MDLGLDGRAVLVTGASRGMGRAIALAYGREHARVAVTYHEDERAATDVVEELRSEGGEGCTVQLDLADPASVESAVGRAAKQLGGLDVVVANAVRWPTDAAGPLAETDRDTWDEALRVNLEGTAATVRASMPHLARSDAGRLVLISSGVAREGRSGATAYATAKAGLDGLVAALKWEAGEQGVLVNIVSPGFTVTERNRENFPEEIRESRRAQTPSTKLSVPEDVAPAVIFLGSPANRNITGAYLPVAGGID